MTRRRPRNQEPTHVGAMLGGTSPLASTGHIDRERWRTIVGDRVASRTRPGRIRDGQLTVHVASAVWAQELSLFSTTILERLKRAGIEARSLRFRVDDVEPLAPSHPGQPRRQRVSLPEELSRKLASIEDPYLRAQMAEAAEYSLGRASKRSATSERKAPRAPQSDGRGNDPTARESPRHSAARKGTAGKR